MNTITAKSLADKIGINKSNVLRRAENLRIRPVYDKGVRVFNEFEADAISNYGAAPGRPPKAEKAPGNGGVAPKKTGGDKKKTANAKS